jgi:hypothetical protein
LGGKQIHAEFPQSVKMRNGDRISVCAIDKNGKLDVLAFKNHSQLITQNTSNWRISVVVGIIFILLVLNIYFFLLKSPELLDQIGVTVFSVIGLYSIYRGLLIKDAMNRLEEQS